MKPEEIAGMLNALPPVQCDRTKAEQILQRYWSEKIAFVWTRSDIHKAANEQGFVLTRSEAMKILDHLRIHYNPQLGIKWIDLWDLIHNSGLGRRMKKHEERAFVERNHVCIEPEKH